MIHPEALSFVRVVYDDRERFPWVVWCGAARVWSRHRTREGALRKVEKLQKTLSEFAELLEEE